MSFIPNDFSERPELVLASVAGFAALILLFPSVTNVNEAIKCAFVMVIIMAIAYVIGIFIKKRNE